ncbi:MAG: 4Fe-4S binding protein [Pseudomonadota bacterium]
MEKLRLKVQILMAVLLNLGIYQWHGICFPVLNCYSCPISVFSCPIGIIGQFTGLGLIALTAVGGIALGGLIAGRFLCGWVCPFGLFQELLYKIPYVKFTIPGWTRFIKYGVFAGLVVAVPYFFSTESPLYFCRLCPVATIESAVPWALWQGTTNAAHLALRLGILLVIVVMVMGHRRFFCKVLCPLGACLSVFNRLSYIFPGRDSSCIECTVCNKVCPMESSPGKKASGVFDHTPEECISCLECRKKCPTKAIRIWG